MEAPAAEIRSADIDKAAVDTTRDLRTAGTAAGCEPEGRVNSCSDRADPYEPADEDAWTTSLADGNCPVDVAASSSAVVACCCNHRTEPVADALAAKT